MLQGNTFYHKSDLLGNNVLTVLTTQISIDISSYIYFCTLIWINFLQNRDFFSQMLSFLAIGHIYVNIVKNVASIGFSSTRCDGEMHKYGNWWHWKNPHSFFFLHCKLFIKYVLPHIFIRTDSETCDVRKLCPASLNFRK